MDFFQGIDRSVIEAATQVGGSGPGRDAAVFLVAEILPLVFAGAALWLFFAGRTKAQRERNQDMVLVSLLSVLFAIGVRFLLINVIERPRPFVTYPELHHAAGVTAGNVSFPSLHALILFAFAGSVFWLGKHRKLGIVLLVIASVVAVARVVAGVHYASDVIAGAALGLVVARLVTWQSKYVTQQVS